MIKKYSTQLILNLTLLLSNCLALCATAQSALPQSPADLILEVKPTKSVYLKNDPIELDFTLRNSGKSPQIVARRLSLGMRIKLDILDPSDKPAKWCGRIADELFVLRDNYKTLAPGESMHQRLVISCDNMKDAKRGGYILDAPGRYMIKAAYLLPIPKEGYDKVFPNAHVIRGPVWAEPVTIDLQ
jgi:hypothetical protein